MTEAKRRYAETLRSLEQISAEIHHQRGEARVRREMGGRGSGVGAECPEPPSVVERRNMVRIEIIMYFLTFVEFSNNSFYIKNS